MDRQITHTGALIPNAVLLGGEKAKLVSLGYALEAILGSATAVSGLACTPTVPASLSVVIGPGSIMTTEVIDTAAFGDLGTDGNATVKQGILQEPGKTLILTPPAASGYSQVYLIQAKRSDVDSGTVLPYYNAANPSQPFNGPANSGNEDLTLRASICTIALKPGVAAPTGSQTAPSPDAGYVGLYAITLVNGQTQITSGNIVVYAGAPFVPVKLPLVPAGVQSGGWVYGTDTGTAGALAAALNPVPAALPDGMEVRVRAANAAAGGDTFNLNGLGALPIKRRGGATPLSGDWAANDILALRKLGSSWQLAGLVASDTAQTNTSYLIAGGRAVSYATPGTYSWTVPDGVFVIEVELWGAGGSGAGGQQGFGGGPGGYSKGAYAVTPRQVLSIVVGAGGAPSGGDSGNYGGISSVSNFIYASGGGPAINSQGLGGVPGSSGGGSVNVTASRGGGAAYVVGSGVYGQGAGGGAPFGGAPGQVGLNSNGADGVFPGGGSGGSSLPSGISGRGAAGFVIIRY